MTCGTETVAWGEGSRTGRSGTVSLRRTFGADGPGWAWTLCRRGSVSHVASGKAPTREAALDLANKVGALFLADDTMLLAADAMCARSLSHDLAKGLEAWTSLVVRSPGEALVMKAEAVAALDVAFRCIAVATSGAD